MYVVTGHVFLFVGIGLWGQAIILCCRVMCSRVYLIIFFFFFTFNLLLVLIFFIVLLQLILLCFIRP
jgi:hypothetical protein